MCVVAAISVKIYAENYLSLAPLFFTMLPVSCLSRANKSQLVVVPTKLRKMFIDMVCRGTFCVRSTITNKIHAVYGYRMCAATDIENSVSDKIYVI